ncbi:MAG TPA: hypothetical protein DD979_15360 [Gammaproteobacteria bacterium]|nr:hypothetical protein [Gammaproteobacteria bacterium]
MTLSTIKKAALTTALLAGAGTAHASYEFKLTENDTLTFSGFIKVDARYVDGDVGYRDFWIGTGTPLEEDASQFRIFANETRFNTKYVHGDVTGFIEMDFYGGGGNEIVSNSANPRIRHAFISYQNLLAGQTWTTFMNTSAIPESADFAGAAVGLAFVRQGQIRYTLGDFQVAIENPESWGGDTANDDLPDFVGRYNLKGDWGNVSVSGLVRNLTTETGDSETGFGASVAGRVNTVGKDDVRFQVHTGELGRYIGVAFTPDVAGEEIESLTSYIVAYRHFWNDTMRSTVLYGAAEADESDAERNQWSINFFNDLTKKLTMGVEVGEFSMDDADVSSVYGQLSFKYSL